MLTEICSKKTSWAQQESKNTTSGVDPTNNAAENGHHLCGREAQGRGSVEDKQVASDHRGADSP